MQNSRKLAIRRLPSAVCRLPSAVCRLPSAVCRLPPAVCRLPSAVCRLPSAVCLLPPAASPQPPVLYSPRFLLDIRVECGAPMIDSDLLDPYEKLIPIEILGHRVEVPENNRLLRCFQFLSLQSISHGDFCWNGDCTNCQIWYHTEGETQGDDKPALSCRTNVAEGMVITRLSRFVELEGINK